MDRKLCWLSGISAEANSPTDSHSHSVNYDLESWVGVEQLKTDSCFCVLVTEIYAQVNITPWTHCNPYCLASPEASWGGGDGNKAHFLLRLQFFTVICSTSNFAALLCIVQAVNSLKISQSECCSLSTHKMLAHICFCYSVHDSMVLKDELPTNVLNTAQSTILLRHY